MGFDDDVDAIADARRAHMETALQGAREREERMIKHREAVSRDVESRIVSALRSALGDSKRLPSSQETCITEPLEYGKFKVKYTRIGSDFDLNILFQYQVDDGMTKPLSNSEKPKEIENVHVGPQGAGTLRLYGGIVNKQSRKEQWEPFEMKMPSLNGSFQIDQRAFEQFLKNLMAKLV